jgi:hypothetical protein
MSAAATLRAVVPPEPQERSVTLCLTADEAAVVASALLAQSVLVFNASSAQEAAGRYDRASGLLHDGYVISRVETRLRQEARK